jgi:hypothetical protein
MPVVLTAPAAGRPACAGGVTTGPGPPGRAAGPAGAGQRQITGPAEPPLRPGFAWRWLLRAGRRRSAEPDALRVPGAVAEGAGLCAARADRRAQLAGGLAYTAGVVLSSWRWPACCWRCAPAASSSAGASSCSRRLGGGAGGAVHADRPEPGRRVRVRLGAAVAGRRRRRATRWSTTTSSPACWRWPWPRPARRRSWAPRWALAGHAAGGAGAGRVRRAGPGHGAALPAASAWPALARLLPRPGAWMAHFKTLMAFPMFATVVWLVWVLGQQVGIDGAAALLGLLVALAFVAWALGSPALGRGALAASAPLAVLLLAAALAWAAPALRQEAMAQAGRRRRPTRWQPWSPSAWPRPGAGPHGVRRLHRRLVRDLPVQQAHHAGRRRGEGAFEPSACCCCAPTGRGATPPSPPSWRAGPQRRAGVCLYAPGAAGPRLLSEILSVDEVRDAVGSPAPAERPTPTWRPQMHTLLERPVLATAALALAAAAARAAAPPSASPRRPSPPSTPAARPCRWPTSRASTWCSNG